MSPAVRQEAISCITAVIAAVVAGSAGSPVGSASIAAVCPESVSARVRTSVVERGVTSQVMAVGDVVGLS